MRTIAIFSKSPCPFVPRNVVVRRGIVSANVFGILCSLLMAGCSGSGSSGGNSSTQQVATPVISPSGGTYAATQTVTVTDATSGASIHCTTDGSNPLISSGPCASTSLSTSGTTTFKAYATLSGDTDSAVATATFTINLPQTASPTITPATGTYSSPKTVTITGPAGASIYYSTTGTATTSSTPYTAPFTVSSTTTVSAVAIVSGSTVSSPATSTITIVPQAISMPATLATTYSASGDIVLNGSIVTASATCPPASVTGVWVADDPDTTAHTGVTLSSYQSDSTNTTYGTFHTGNSASQSRSGTGTLTLTCSGSSNVTASTHITVKAPNPVPISASPNVCAPSSCTILVTGTGFMANNSSTSLTQEQGTTATSNLGACPTTLPTQGGGMAFVDFTHAYFGYTAGGTGAVLGSWNMTTINQPTLAGGDGGATCTLNVYAVTATGHAVGAPGSLTRFDIDPETGLAAISVRGEITGRFALGGLTYNPVVTATTAYAMQPLSHTVIAINVATNSVSSISLGSFEPTKLAADIAGNVYVLASNTSAPSDSQIMAIKDGFATRVGSAKGYTDIAVVNGYILGIAPSEDGSTTSVHLYSINAAKEERRFTVQRKMTSVLSLPNGLILGYTPGLSMAGLIDLDSQEVSETITFASGVLNVSGDHIALLNGDIGKLTTARDNGASDTLSWELTSRQVVEDLYAGFSVATEGGKDVLNLSHRAASGELLTKRLSLENVHPVAALGTQ